MAPWRFYMYTASKKEKKQRTRVKYSVFSILKISIELNARNSCGTTAFHFACMAGHAHVDLVELLIQLKLFEF